MLAYSPEKFNEAELVGVFENGSEEWLQARKSGVGGSDVGAIMGLNPWESAYSLWAKKTNQIAEMPLTSKRVKFGQKFEQPILEIWAEENPDWIVYQTGTYRHSVHKHILANPDALAHNPVTDEWMVIEVKTSAAPWTAVPAHYESQVMQYLFVFGLQKAKVIGVVGWDWWESDLEYNDFVGSLQLDYVTKFWENCQTMNKPDWDGSDATYKTVKELNPLIEDTTHNTPHAQALWDAQKDSDKAYQNLNYWKSRILDEMSTAKHAVGLVDGEEVRVASRQMRSGAPTLIVRRK